MGGAAAAAAPTCPLGGPFPPCPGAPPLPPGPPLHVVPPAPPPAVAFAVCVAVLIIAVAKSG